MSEVKVQSEGVAQALKDKGKLAQARFKVRDVVTTGKPVTCFGPSDKKDGQADPGWKWRIVKVYVDWTSMASSTRALYYDVVAHAAPKFYRTRLRDGQIDGKVGEHKEPLPLDGPRAI